MATKRRVKDKKTPLPKELKISVSFYYEQTDGKTGFDRIIVSDMSKITNRFELDAIENQILAIEEKNYIKITVINYIILEL